MFNDGLGEFDLARESAQSVIAEYEACEQPGYGSVA
jgi:hypothetical protein